MSSERPGGPADVVPGEPDPPRDTRAAADPEGPMDEPEGRAGRRRRRNAEGKKGSLLRELPVLLVVAFLLALVVKTFFVQAFFIPSGSMEQTLHGCPGCTGDRVLVNKVPYWFGEPEPGDVVVFKGPDTWTPEVTVAEPGNWFTSSMLWLGRTVGVAPPSEDDFVKRVIAVGGQTVECCDAEGRVTVDGEPLDEPYIYENTPTEQRSFAPVTVPEGRLWVMGDHRSASSDSKAHVSDRYSGTIGVDDVIGKAAIRVWPINRFGFVGSPDIQDVEASASGVQAGTAGVRPDLLASSAVGLVGAVPVVAWRRRRRRRR
ncbi:signal peptidase I [Blastococcus sp. TF02-09]|uniref:signal peptidase I n=1 Tax=Blastococcus sp. TF02-09 TaxID=2250576 RepID=UPI000DE8CF42|nr:signal peptidase I [Blastococcus sp. TF02-9]RBY77498.1 signal peptidase I [Blastococcus sp. TF02-9]